MIALYLCLALLWHAAAAVAEPPLKPLTFMPLWVPQAQFAGYFVAYERGLYRQHGIDVTILPGGPGHSVAAALESGRADVGTLWLSTAIRMRAQGSRVVNVAQVVERSSQVLLAKKSSGIAVPSDLNGKTVGVWEGDLGLQAQAFFKKYNLNVRTVPQGSTINLFLRDGVSAAVGMWYNEYHTALDSGINTYELTTFFFSEHGLNFPEDGLYCREEAFLRDPALYRAFAQASLEGWQYAFAQPEDALDIVMKYVADAHLAATRVHQRWMLERMKDVILFVNGAPPGTLRRVDYDHVAQALLLSGRITAVPEFAAFYRAEVPR